jgi:hypothetical protein
MPLATDLAGVNAALGATANTWGAVDWDNPATVTAFSSAVAALAAAAATTLLDVGPFLGSASISAAVGSATSDAMLLHEALEANDVDGIVSAGLGLLADAASIAASFAALAAAAEAGSTVAGSIAAIAVLLALAKNAYDNAGGIKKIAQYFGNALRDPLVVDLAGTGLNLTAETPASTHFSWNGDEFANATGWIGAGTGFLVQAPSEGGPITVADFITSFAELRALDGNHNGVLDSSDPGFANLEVWQDTNGDGIAEAGEVSTLSALGIQSISLNASSADHVQNGNTVEAVSSFTMTDGSVHEIAAVSFAYSRTFTQFTGPDTPSAAAAVLPQLHGYGNLPDLQEAMTNDPTLLGLVQAFVQMSTDDSVALGTAIVDVMFRWAGVGGVDPTSRGSGISAQQLEFLERLTGTPFLDAHGNVNPWFRQEVDDLGQAWTFAFNDIAARLLLQGAMAGDLAADFIFDPTSDLIVCTTSLSQAVQDVVAQAPADPAAALSYWWGAITVLDSYLTDWQQIDGSTGQTIVPATQADFDAMLSAAAPSLTRTVLASLRAEQFGGLSPNGSGGSVYVYEPDAGILEIKVDAGWGNSATAGIVFGGGITSTDVSASADSSGALYLTDGTPGDQIMIDWMLLPGGNDAPEYGVGSVEFSDSTIWTAQQVIDLADAASASNRLLYGFTPNSSFAYRPGTGSVDIHADAGWAISTSATLTFGMGVTATQLSVSADASGNLYLTDGVAGDQIKLDLMMTLGPGGLPEYGIALVQLADGTSLTAQQLFRLATTGSPTNVRLYGTPGSDVFDSRGYAAFEDGAGGVDTFIYGTGYGLLTIVAEGGGNTLAFSAGVNPSDITIIGDVSGDLILVLDAADQVTLHGAMTDSGLGVQQVTFTDGTVWTCPQMVSMADIGSPSNTRLYGNGDANVLDSQGYATVEAGDGGGDTFVYNSGYGHVEIYEVDFSLNPDNVLQFGPGIVPTDVAISSDDQGDLILTIGDTGDSITIDDGADAASGVYTDMNGQFVKQTDGVQEFEFANGDTWSAAQVWSVLSGPSPGPNLIIVTEDGSVVDGLGGADIEMVDGTDNTFVFNEGYGQLDIIAASEPAVSGVTLPADNDILSFGPGILPSDITVIANPSKYGLDLLIGSDGDEIKLETELDGVSGAQELQFADGTVWTAPQIFANVEVLGTAGDDTLQGDDSPLTLQYGETFDGRGGNDMVDGESGNDRFVFDAGYGTLTIDEYDWSGDNTSSLIFGPGITPDQVTAIQSSDGSALDLLIGSDGDEVVLPGFFFGGFPPHTAAQVVFSDGTTWTWQQLLTLLNVEGTLGDDYLSGVYVAGQTYGETFDGKGGDDVEVGCSGNDSFIFNQDYGQLAVQEYNPVAPIPDSIVKLGPGIMPGDVTVYDDQNEDVVLAIGNGGDRVTLQTMLISPSFSAQAVEFADGTVWDRQQILSMLRVVGTAGDDYLQGSHVGGSAGYAEVFDGQGGNDTEVGFSGNDTFVYNLSYGLLTVNEVASNYTPDSILAFGAGITPSDVTVSVDTSGDLIFTLDSNDQVTIQNALNSEDGTTYGIQQATFADGTVWTYAPGLSMADIGSPAISGPIEVMDTSGSTAAIGGVSLSESGSIPGETFSVTVAAANGLLSASGSNLSGSGTGTLTISGSLDDVNTALATLTDTDSVAGADTITYGASDSIGGSLSDSGDTSTLLLSGPGTFDLTALASLTGIQVIDAQEGQLAYADSSEDDPAQDQTIYLRDNLDVTVNVSPATLIPGNPGPATITIIGANDTDVINLASGDDSVIVGSAGETINGGTGDDTITVTAATIGAAINGGSGTSTLEVAGGGNVVMGGSITNISQVLLAVTANQMTFVANAISGLMVNDVNTGADSIQAGGLSQILTGGSGQDTFIGFTGGETIFLNTAEAFNGDTIASFASSNDLIDFTDIGFVAGPSVNFVEGGDGMAGTLTVSDGTRSASVTLSGQFDASEFHPASDGNTGTAMTYH